MSREAPGSPVTYVQEELEEIRRKVTERGLTPCHAFFASLLASLAEINALNQAVANLIAKKAAPTLHKYLKAMNKLDIKGETPLKRFEELVRQLNDALEIGQKVEIKHEDGNVVNVGIGGSYCRYCPKGVGGAQIPGTACPFPRLIEHIAKLEGINAELVIIREGARFEEVHREEGLCWIKYKLH